MAQLVECLQPPSDGDFWKILTEWNSENAKNSMFSDIAFPQRKDIFACLLKQLRENRQKLPDETAEKQIALCLESVRILSREKMALDDSFHNEDDVWLIIDLAKLKKTTETPGENYSHTVEMEALKCLCNVMYNCPAVQGVCNNASVVDAVVANIERETTSSQQVASDVFYVILSCKILFLITGFNRSMRSVALKRGGTSALANYISAKLPSLLTDLQFNECINESLKAIFNIISSADLASDNGKAEFEVLAKLLCCLFLAKDMPRCNDIYFQASALLTVLPFSCFSLLLLTKKAEQETLGGSEGNGEKKTVDCEESNTDFSAIEGILSYLDYALINKTDTEHMVPLLIAMSRMCRANRLIRRHVRRQVLPPLKEQDVRRLPQEGTTLRNRLCRLLTNPSMEVKEHTADLLFVLCKENVNRLIKYAGFGNAAGLLANRGLLGRVGQAGGANAEYSEDSDVDTEEYSSVRAEVNPVTGRVDPPTDKNPFEGMTEEQKEYEAMQLVNAIDRLQRQGIIQPAQFSDGVSGITGNSQQPVEHVLQLRDDFLKKQAASSSDKN